MPITTRNLLDQYTEILQKIYGKHLKKVILYGSYARGDYRDDSDIDIMILLDLSDMDIKQYRHELSGETFDFNMDHDLDIKPIAKSQQHFQNWVDAYPFYANVEKERPKHLNYELQTQHDRFRNMHDYWHHETLSHLEGSLRL